jgi:hypothetical protein
VTPALIRSPIDNLVYFNGIFAFENPSGSAVDRMRQAVEQGLLSPEIVIDNSEGSPIFPFVCREKNLPAVIHLQTAYLEHLWAFLFGWFVIFEEAVQKPLLENGEAVGAIVFDTPLKCRAQGLLKWAESLRSAYSRWPPHLPTPHSDLGDEGDYSRKTNQLFTNALAYVLHHEYTHATQKHLGPKICESTEAGTAAREATEVEMENEADDAAFSALIAQHDDGKARRLKAWGILAPSLAKLSLVERPDQLLSKTHPAAHHRVLHTLTRLNFPDPKSKYYFHHLVSILLGDLLSRLSTETRLQQTYDTAEEAVHAILDQLDAIATTKRKRS